MAKDQSGVSGAKCDELIPGFNSQAKDHHSQRIIGQVIESPDFQKGGWQIVVVPYKIFGSETLHTDVQLLRPEGADAARQDIANGRMVTSIDVWSPNKDDAGFSWIPYPNNTAFMPVLDDCKADNKVVTDDREATAVRRGVGLSGTGPEVLKKFLEMAEYTTRARGLTYFRGPNAENKGFNSNSLPKALFDLTGLPYPPALAALSGGDNVIFPIGETLIPGRERGEELAKILAKGGRPYFASVPASEITDPKHRGEMARVLDALKMETQQAQICRDARKEDGCAVLVPVTP